MGKRAAGVLVALVAAFAVAPAGQQVPTFKSDVNAVLVDVRVVDRDGQFVNDLSPGRPDALRRRRRADDHHLHPRRYPDSPGRAAPSIAGEPVDADVASNGGGEGRLYVLLLDDYHTHTFRSPTVRALAREFIEKNFTESDRAVVLTTSGRVKMVQEFTNNRKRLFDLVDRFEGGFEALSRCDLVAPTGQEKASAQQHVMIALAPVVESGACTVQDDRTSLEVLTGLAKWLAGVNERRKAIVFISEGFDGRMSNAFDEPESDVDAYLDDLTGGSATRSKQSDAATMISADLKDAHSGGRAREREYLRDRSQRRSECARIRREAGCCARPTTTSSTPSTSRTV